MRWEIEPTGCRTKGNVRQIRLCFYLDPGDARYSEHHVHVPIAPKGGYPGKIGPNGRPKSDVHFRQWVDSLPKELKTNPFHNHFTRVPVGTSEEAIAEIADGLLPTFYKQWKNRERLGGD